MCLTSGIVVQMGDMGHANKALFGLVDLWLELMLDILLITGFPATRQSLT